MKSRLSLAAAAALLALLLSSTQAQNPGKAAPPPPSPPPSPPSPPLCDPTHLTSPPLTSLPLFFSLCRCIFSLNKNKNHTVKANVCVCELICLISVTFVFFLFQ